jgi:hypothetical protein
LPYLKKLEQLEQRVAELEAGAMKYCGVYQPSASYQRGNVVTCDGSAFHATRNVSAERPGTTDAWQLMIKTRQRRVGVHSVATRCGGNIT